MISQHVEDEPAEEMARRAAAFSASNGRRLGRAWTIAI
jgi:hypothetical protein